MKKHIKKEQGENEKEFSETNAEGKTIALMNNDEIVKTKMKKKKATIACKVYNLSLFQELILKSINWISILQRRELYVNLALMCSVAKRSEVTYN